MVSYSYMKSKQKTKEEFEHKELVRLVEKAEKEAKKFVRANMQVEKRLQFQTPALPQ